MSEEAKETVLVSELNELRVLGKGMNCDILPYSAFLILLRRCYFTVSSSALSRLFETSRTDSLFHTSSVFLCEHSRTGAWFGALRSSSLSYTS